MVRRPLLAVLLLALLCSGPAAGQEPAEALRQARARLAAGDPDGAAAVLAPLAAEPASAPPAVLAFLAGLRVDQGRAEEALALLAPRLEGAGPAEAELLFVAARAARALGRGEEAERHLARSAALAPQSRAAVLLATLRTQAERHAEAAALLAPIVEGDAFAATVAADPGFAHEILVHYGTTLVALSRAADAVPHLRRAAELRPDDAAAWKLLGRTLVESGEVDAARQALARAQELEEAAHRRAVEATERREEARGLVERAVALHGEGKHAEALELLARAAELAPADPVPRMLEVRLLVSLERRDEALAAADALVAQVPSSPEVLHLRGMARWSFGDAAGAEADLRRALELDPEHREALTGLALALMAQQRLAEAGEVLDRVLARWPDDATARRARGRLDDLR